MPTQQKLTGISVIFPAYNEESNAERAVAAAVRALSGRADRVEIIVVNDGSHDRTGAVLDDLAARDPHIVAVHHPRNQGYGAALRSGFARARCDFVFFTDTDLQFDLEEIDALIPWIGAYDIVAGYRVKRADPWYRRMNAWGWNMLIRLLLDIRVRDIDCAFKLFRRRVFDAMQLGSRGALINTEILALARQQGFTIREVPVSHYPRASGKQTGASLGVILRAFRELLTMYGRLRQSKNAAAAEPVRKQHGNIE